MAKVTVDNLAKEIDKILDEYKGEIEQNLDKIVVQVGKKGVQALRNESKSKFKGSGKYAKGWTSTAERGRLYTTVIIHNSKMPGLPHLLEFGHAIVVGGRKKGDWEGIEHIAKVEDKLVADFEREVVSKL